VRKYTFLTIFMFYFLANSCYKENCYFKMYLVLLLVKWFRVEGDKNRFQKGVEKDLIVIGRVDSSEYQPKSDVGLPFV